jgi:hypothetical protein
MVRLVRRLSSAASWAAVCGADGAAELVERTEELSIAGAGFCHSSSSTRGVRLPQR